MKGKKILILGAGVYQKPLVRKVKEMGHIALVVSPKGNYPGIEYADMYFDLDTTDIEGVLKIAQENSINAIVTTGTDVCMPTLGKISDTMGLNGVSFQTALQCMDKVLMKNAFKKHKVPTANFEIFSDYKPALVFAEKLGYPIMVKASDSSGSRGVFKVTMKKDFENAFNSALLVSRNKKIVVEEFLDGLEFGAQAIVSNNKLVKLVVHGDIVNKGEITTPIGHYLPLDFESSLLSKIHDVTINAIEALNINDCVSNIDFMLVENEPKIIEIGARMGGTCLPENVSIFFDENIYAYAIDLALGNNPVFNGKDVQPNASLILTSEKSGIIESIDIPESVKNHPSIVEIVIDVKQGDMVRKFEVGPDRLGHVITKAQNAEDAIKLANEIASTIKFNLKTD